MFDEINKPYSWEKEFYQKNNIPQWECKTHETKDLGKIYEAKDGSFIKAKVRPTPAQFWEFEIYCADNKTILKLSTGSGTLEDFFGTMKNFAQDMIVIKSINAEI